MQMRPLMLVLSLVDFTSLVFATELLFCIANNKKIYRECELSEKNL
jgi:hypothetical protein